MPPSWVLIVLEPEALRRRLRHLHPPDLADRALGGYFRLGNLGALRDLAQRWIAELHEPRASTER